MSAGEQKHDYHLVDPSPWPIYTSFATLVTAIGTVYYFHSEVMWAMILGFVLLIYGAFMWFRDVVIEAEHQGHHTPVVQIHHRYGMTLFIASEVMFFVAWFWAYFDASLFPSEFVGNVWPPKDIETFDPWDIPLINTLVFLGFPGSIMFVAEILFFSFFFDLFPILCLFFILLLYLIAPTFFFRI